MSQVKVEVLNIVLAPLKSKGNLYICHILEDLAQGKNQLDSHSHRLAALDLRDEVAAYVKPFHCYDTWYDQKYGTRLYNAQAWEARMKFVQQLIDKYALAGQDHR